MEQQMQQQIDAGISERERCYNEITELEHLRDALAEQNKQLQEKLDAQAAHLHNLHEALKAFSNVKAPGGFARDTREYDRAMGECWQNLWAVINTAPEQALSTMQADRDALAAQVTSQQELLKIWQTWLGSSCNTCDEYGKLLWDKIEVVCSKPQQCLAEIKAEAGRAGFIAGYHKMHIEFVGSLASSEGAEFAADQYAAKVRQGE